MREIEFVYVRFGIPPISGKSKNSFSGKEEKGVSVYEAIKRNGKYQIILPKLGSNSIGTIGRYFNLLQSLYFLKDEKRTLFLVEGQKIGTGSDGEPLLHKCKVIKKIINCDIK